MSKHFGNLHDLSTGKSTMTEVKAKQHVNFMSWGSERENTHEATHDTDSFLGIRVAGHRSVFR